MKPSLRILISAVARSALPLPAFAADYEPPIVVDQPVEEVPVEVGSGWYLRGDIGYNFGVDARGQFRLQDFNPLTGAYSSGTFDTASLGEQRHLERRLRLQFHGHVPRRFHGRRLPHPTSMAPRRVRRPASPSGPAGNGCRSEDESTAAVLSFMVNGYVDLGTYVGITPYVGGGLGYTVCRLGAALRFPLLHQALPVPRHCLPTPSTTATKVGASPMPRWPALPMTSRTNLKVDLGYRYRRIEGGPMFDFDPGSIAAGASGTPGRRPWLLVARSQHRPALCALVGTHFSNESSNGGLRSAICLFGSRANSNECSRCDRNIPLDAAAVRP